MEDLPRNVGNVGHWVDWSEDSVEQINSFIRVCLPKVITSDSGNIANSFKIRADSESKTLAQTVDFSSEFDRLFEDLNKALTGSNVHIQDQVYFTDLVTMIRQMGSLYTIKPDSITNNAANYNSANTNAMTDTLKATAECLSRTVDFNSGSDTGANERIAAKLGVSNTFPTTLQGVLGLVALLSSDGVTGLPSVTTCASFTAANMSGVQSPYNKLLNLFKTVRNTTFVCGTNTACTYDQFVTYVLSLADDIMAAAVQVDAELDSKSSSVQVDLRAAITTNITSVISSLLERLDCSFMAVVFNSILTSFCHVSIPGMMLASICWIVMGVIGLLTIFMEFNIWRRLKDNSELWNDAIHGLMRN